MKCQFRIIFFVDSQNKLFLFNANAGFWLMICSMLLHILELVLEIRQKIIIQIYIAFHHILRLTHNNHSLVGIYSTINHITLSIYQFPWPESANWRMFWRFYFFVTQSGTCKLHGFLIWDQISRFSHRNQRFLFFLKKTCANNRRRRNSSRKRRY